MDAANVDLKGFTEGFYQHLTLSHLQPVLDTLVWLKHESSVWIEITNLVIPGENDSADEIREMCVWIRENLGIDVPIHFTAFHPDFRLRNRPPTPPETLVAAYDIAKDVGLQYVYTGNVSDDEHQSTYCPSCSRRLIERRWYKLSHYNLKANRCEFCGAEVAGQFGEGLGRWTSNCVPVNPSQLLHELEST